MKKYIILVILILLGLVIYFHQTAKFNLGEIRGYNYVSNEKDKDLLKKFVASYENFNYIYVVQLDTCYIFDKRTGKIQVTSIDQKPRKYPLELQLYCYENSNVEYVAFEKLTKAQQGIIIGLLSIPRRDNLGRLVGKDITINDY